jgi:hypothetical protein
MNRDGSETISNLTSVVDPHHVDADPDYTFHPDADPDPEPSVQIKAQTIEKAHIPFILACQLQIDADPVPDPAYHFEADLDFYLLRMRIQVTKMMRIWIQNAGFDALFIFLLRENLSLKESLVAAETGREQARSALERLRQEHLQETELLRQETGLQGAAQPAGVVAAQLLSALQTCQNQLPDHVR